MREPLPAAFTHCGEFKAGGRGVWNVMEGETDCGKISGVLFQGRWELFQRGYRYVTVGNTEKVAKVISELVGADLFKIEQNPLCRRL